MFFTACFVLGCVCLALIVLVCAAAAFFVDSLDESAIFLLPLIFILALSSCAFFLNSSPTDPNTHEITIGQCKALRAP